jgi:hypothetical protein
LKGLKKAGLLPFLLSTFILSYFFKIFVFIRVIPLPAIALAQARRAGWFPLSLVASGAAKGG